MKCVGASRIDYDRFTIIAAISVQAVAPAAHKDPSSAAERYICEKGAVRPLSRRAGNE